MELSLPSGFCFSLYRILYFLDALNTKKKELKGCSMTTANVRSQLDKRLREAFREIIDGKTVKRSKHELMFGGIDVSNVFVDEMDKKNYLPAAVGDIACEQGATRSGILYRRASGVFWLGILGKIHRGPVAEALWQRCEK